MRISFLPALLLCVNLTITANELSGDTAKAQLLETHQCPRCDLSGIDLSNQNLAGANLKGAILNGAILAGTNLRGANLEGAQLLNVELFEISLAGANLKNADLTGTDIDQVFEYVEIIGTQLEGARFKHGVVCGPAPKKGGWGCQQL